jgi:hypothetical protein
MTLAPSVASRCDIASPMPLAAPVTTATLPENLVGMEWLLGRGTGRPDRCTASDASVTGEAEQVLHRDRIHAAKLSFATHTHMVKLGESDSSTAQRNWLRSAAGISIFSSFAVWRDWLTGPMVRRAGCTS